MQDLRITGTARLGSDRDAYEKKQSFLRVEINRLESVHGEKLSHQESAGEQCATAMEASLKRSHEATEREAEFNKVQEEINKVQAQLAALNTRLATCRTARDEARINHQLQHAAWVAADRKVSMAKTNAEAAEGALHEAQEALRGNQQAWQRYGEMLVTKQQNKESAFQEVSQDVQREYAEYEKAYHELYIKLADRRSTYARMHELHNQLGWPTGAQKLIHGLPGMFAHDGSGYPPESSYEHRMKLNFSGS